MSRSAALHLAVAICAAALVAAGCDGDSSGPTGAATLTLATPPAGAVGSDGVTLRALLVPAGRAAPTTLQVVAGETVLGSLPRTGVLGSGSVQYGGPVAPPANLAGPLSLLARAQLPDGTLDSAPVQIQVDTVPPVIAELTASCSVAHGDGKCRRDEELRIAFRALPHPRPVTAAATIDVDGPAPLELVVQGDGGSATVRLSDQAFAFYEKDVAIDLTLRDALGNRSAPLRATAPVTRLRWEYVSGGAAVTAIATTVGSVVFGVTGAAPHVRIMRGGCDPTIAPAPSPPCVVTADVGADVAFPVVGSAFPWVVTVEPRVFSVDLDGSIENGAGCGLASPATGPLALPQSNAGRLVVNSGESIYATNRAGLCDATPLADESFVASPVARGERVFSVANSNASGASTLRAFSFAISGALLQNWTAPVGTNSLAPPVIDRQGRILVASGDGFVYRVTDQTSSATVERLPAQLSGGATASPIVTNDDGIVVPVGSRLHRLDGAGQALWSRDLGAAVVGVAEMRPLPYDPDFPPFAPDRSGTQLLVTTADGKLHALKLDGGDAWAVPGQISAAALTLPNVAIEGGKAILYLGGADGRLRSILIDGWLEDRAPWPKPLRDVSNTSGAF